MMRRCAAGLLALGVVLSLVGCMSEVARDGGGVIVAPSAADASKLGGNLRFEWSQAASVSGVRDIYLDRGIVYVESTGTLSAVDARRGEMLWHFPLRGALDYPPCSSQNKVFIFTDGRMSVLDRTTGKCLVSKNPLLGLVSAPAATDTFVILASARGQLHGIGQESCWPEWTRAIESLVKGVAFVPPDQFYLLTSDSQIRRYSVLSGDVNWEQKLSGEPLAAPGASPDGVYVGMRDYFVTAFNLGGVQIWRKTVGGAVMQPPVVSHGRLFVIADPGVAVVLDAATGEERWRRPGPGRFLTASAERAYFLDTSADKIICFTLAEGTPEGELDCHAFKRFCADPEAGRFVAVGPDGRLYGITDVAEAASPGQAEAAASGN